MSSILDSVSATVKSLFDTVPGSAIIYKYIKQSYQNDPIRSLLELILVVFLIYYYNHRKYKPGFQEVKLTPKEIDELCAEWQPEPLVATLSSFEKQQLEKLPIQIGTAGVRMKNSDGKERLNLSSFNFLGLLNRDKIKEQAVIALRKYGVGSCGPPGFYGTIDVHIELEQKLAAFFGTEAAIIYSQGFSTVASAIPAFAKRGDIIVADEGISFATQKGIDISRSQIHFFRHNDMEDLQKVLEKIQVEELKRKKPLTRKFLVVEGLYLNSGEIAPLPELLALKEKYKYRLIVEESYSFGAIGKSGKGISDYYDIPTNEIDIMCASMANVLGSAGGFVIGTKEIVEHQRLSGQAYTFSAALPALLAVSSTEAIKIMEEELSLFTQLKENTAVFRSTFSKNSQDVLVVGNKDSPILHLRLKKGFPQNREKEEIILQDVVDAAYREGICISRAKYCNGQELLLQKPSIRICITAGLNKKEIERSANVIKDAFKRSIKV